MIENTRSNSLMRQMNAIDEEDTNPYLVEKLYVQRLSKRASQQTAGGHISRRGQDRLRSIAEINETRKW